MTCVELSYSNPSPRMKYGAKLLFDFCIGVEHKWVDGVNDDLIVIKHGDIKLSSPIHPISLSQDEKAIAEGVQFPCNVESDCDLDYDPFASAVFHAAQWKEILLGDQLEKDEHNRFIGHECSRPEVELLALKLSELLGLDFNMNRYSFQPTIDIDVAFAFKGRSSLKSFLNSIRDLILLNWKRFALRIKVLNGKSVDPYDTYKWIDDLHKKYNLQSKAFILFADKKKPYDVSLPESILENLIADLGDWDIHWHPSYHAMSSLQKKDVEVFSKEKSNFPCNSSTVRAHFLRCDVRHWSQLVELGVKEDYSLGYARFPGFRSGMCRPYPAYDLLKDEELPLTIYPVVVMDSSLKSYMNLSPEKAIEVVSKLNHEVRNVGGQMITIFHNTSVSDFEEWKGWRKAYEEIVDLCSKPNS